MAAIAQLNNTIKPTAASSYSTGAAAMTATLAAQAGETTYLEGFDVTGEGATAAGVVKVAVTGLACGELDYTLPILSGTTGPMNAQGGLFIRFPEPLPAAAQSGAAGLAAVAVLLCIKRRTRCSVRAA